ncbi:MAG: sigma-70 family RNA polymerase sigma factor [Saprospiraceae bacterium]|nr:sigma-70 family RNA polymerase sigma factor [Saprospiraceae bacterium]
MAEFDKQAFEHRIVELLKSNPREAVSEILEHYGDALFTVALRIVGTTEVAEEIIQDAFVKVWQKADQYDPNKGKLFTWLIQIVRSTAIDKVRLVKFQQNRKSQSLDANVYDNVAFSEEMKVKDVGLRRVIEQLDEKYRVIIRLLYFNGYTQSEVTEELGIPLGTVKSRAKIGIRELRRLLGGTTVLTVVVAIIWYIFM